MGVGVSKLLEKLEDGGERGPEAGTLPWNAESSWLLRKHICQRKCSLYLSPHSTSRSTERISLGEFKHYLEPRWQRTLGNVVPCLPAPKSKGDSRSSLE